MMMHFPVEIIFKRLGQNFGGVRLGHHNVMLETIFADVVHELLQARNFCDGAVAERVEFVVRQFAFADVSADFSIGIGRRDSAKGQRPAGVRPSSAP